MRSDQSRIDPADYDRWLISGPGGPNDPEADDYDEEELDEDERERRRVSEDAEHDRQLDNLRD